MTDLDRKKYEVSGTDYQGDVHSFESDDPERALAMFGQFQEDFEPVIMSEPLERCIATRKRDREPRG